MPARRTFLISASAFIGASSLPGFAERADVDLAVEESPSDTPIRRKYMMEDTRGNLVRDDDLRGKFVLIYFGYMSCPDVCPITLSTLSDVMAELGDMNEDLHVVFVTVDPDRDTPEKLHDYLSFFDKRIIGLRGPKVYTDHMVKAFNSRYEFYYPDSEDKSEYTVDHTASMAFVDPFGNMVKRFAYGLSAEEITKDIQTVINDARVD